MKKLTLTMLAFCIASPAFDGHRAQHGTYAHPDP